MNELNIHDFLLLQGQLKVKISGPIIKWGTNLRKVPLVHRGIITLQPLDGFAKGKHRCDREKKLNLEKMISWKNSISFA